MEEEKKDVDLAPDIDNKELTEEDLQETTIETEGE